MYCYVFVRTDIPLADQMVQIGHVCHRAGVEYGEDVALASIVLVGVRNLDALCDAMAHLDRNMIAMVFVKESDPVEPGGEPMGITAACTEPLDPGQRAGLRRFECYRPK